MEEIEQLVVRMAEEKATWGYRRIQGALANRGHSIAKITAAVAECECALRVAHRHAATGMLGFCDPLHRESPAIHHARMGAAL
jgi:hypothetical protein